MLDFVAIGLGPFNLGLACLTEPIEELHGIFLEREPEFSWHPGMILDGTHLQTPFLSDLVTMAAPTSPYSFLNYLKSQGRLYQFYIRENFFPLRAEYADYCRWAAKQLPAIRFGETAVAVHYDAAGGSYHVVTQHGEYHARTVIVGTGSPPHLPQACLGLGGDFIHNSRYREHRQLLRGKRSIVIIGSGQSAAEVVHDLLGDIDTHGYELTWVTRSPRFFPLEYTKLTLEMTSVDYLEYFHALPENTRYQLDLAHAPLYRGIDAALINDIYDMIYAKSVAGPVPLRFFTNTELRSAAYDLTTASYRLRLHHQVQDRTGTLTTDGLVLATGYRFRIPEFLAPIRDRLRLYAHGNLDVARDYSIDTNGGEIFLQSGPTYTHSITAPDLGMGAYRNSCLIRSLLGREHYPIEQSTTFQTFSFTDPARS